ncbi:MAG: L-ribulose-5-phosphate 3-epimerase [Clostridia bacterium]|nr:L-ribulose-5-phosphate 3-epimerase [Clostridia bacterium]
MKNYLTGVYEKAFPEEISITEMLTEARNAGFDFFEINIDRTEQRISRVYDPHFNETVKHAVSESGLPVRSLGLSALGTYTLGHPDNSISSRGMDIFRHTVEFAEDLGIRLIQIPGADMPKFDPRSEATHERFMDNLQSAVSFASSRGVMIALENMENDYMDTAEKSRKTTDLINSPYLQLYLDSGNITNAHANNMPAILKDLDFAANRLAAFHFKEVTPVRYGGLFYGDGWVNFEPIAKKAYALGARRFTMEYWYTGNTGWRDDLKKARQYCDKWLAESEA